MAKLFQAVVWLALVAQAQSKDCVPPSSQRLVIYRAGSLTRAFQPLIATFTCQTGVQVKDVAMGSVDAARQITAGGQAADIFAAADYLDIDLLLKPAGYASFNIIFAQGSMVLAYSTSALAAKKLPSVAEGTQPFLAGSYVPKASADWYKTLTRQGVAIGAGHPFLDPSAYRTPMIFQLAEEFYHSPNLYNNMLEHVSIGALDSGATLGKQFDFQFIYEHTARATALTNPDYAYVKLPDEIGMSDDAKDPFYKQHAVVAVPGLGTLRSSRTIAVPASRVRWGLTIMKEAPNKDNAIKFLQLLLGPAGTASLNQYGPSPIAPALVSPGDLGKLPEALRALVGKSK